VACRPLPTESAFIMCRLYGFQATHPTEATCELLDAQNALIQQSQHDARGLSNPHGWGVGHVADGVTHCFRQVQPASESPAYREAALSTKSTTLVAHVRRATVGSPRQENTHPFRHGDTLLIHNGHIPRFDDVRPYFLDRVDGSGREAIRGTTDSEHILALLLQLRREMPDAPASAITREAVRLVQSWVHEVDPGVTVDASDADFSTWSHEDLTHVLALNILWTDGGMLAGARLNRTLWGLQRRAVYACPICGEEHADPGSDEAYRVVALASERITAEDWFPIPNGSVFSVDRTASLHTEAPHEA